MHFPQNDGVLGSQSMKAFWHLNCADVVDFKEGNGLRDEK